MYIQEKKTLEVAGVREEDNSKDRLPEKRVFFVVSQHVECRTFVWSD